MFKQGIVIYETYVPKNSYNITMACHDVGFVYLDGKFANVFDRGITK